MELKIAFLQLLPTGSLEGNLAKGTDACRNAKARGADIALFPEMWSCGYAFSHDPAVLRQQAVPSDGAFVRHFAELAAELDMAIAVTLLERHEPRPRNTVCLFDRHGALCYRYSKVHTCNFDEPDDESVLDPGDGFYTAALDTAAGELRVGSMICYDREFPESARLLALQGAELLLVPNACPMEINRLSQLRGRAYEDQLAIATCNYPAPHPDCNGRSTLFDGVAFDAAGWRDMCVLEAGGGEQLALATLDVDALRAFRARELCSFRNRRTALYGPIADPR